jgi:tetratricopeptide (TPR) repeat protein
VASDQAKELRQRGIAAAKAGDKEQARQLLQQSIRLEPTSEPAWLWLASVARDSRERMFCLRKILEINPSNEQAIKALRQLEVTLGTAPLPPEPEPGSPPPSGMRRLGAEPAPPAAPRPATRTSTQEMMAQPSGVPLPEREAVAQAAQLADAVIRQTLQEPTSELQWVKKTRGRVGEADIWRLRAYIGAAAAVAMTLLCTGSFIVVSNTPELARVAFGATLTPTFTPTFTPTSTPGVTPTPSATPRVAPPATATVPPLFPTADVYSPDATAVYPEILDAPLRGAVSLLDRGELAAALPTLASERANTSTRFNAGPYYYEAVALARSGDLAGALRILRDAEERLPEAPNDNFAPVVDVGFAYVLNLQAQDAALNGNTARVQSLASEAQERAQAAIQRDPRLVQSHLELARSLYLQGNATDAIAALDAGLQQPALQFDTNLIAEKARIYFEEGDYDEADRQAYLVLYTDPSVEIAHQIQVDVALLDNDPGLAVLRAQAYLFYYPGSAVAWRSLGDARLDEGNYNLAIDAYSQALTADQEAETTVAALRGRARAYSAQGRYSLALADFAEALEIAPSDALRGERMVAAYGAGELATAQEDAVALAGSSDVPAGLAALIRGRVLVDEARAAGDAPGEEAIAQLEAARAGANDERLGGIDEYIAWAHYLNGESSAALDSINVAIDRAETAERYYLRGLILEARGQDANAAEAYDWVVAWSAIYPVPFAEDAQQRLNVLR